MDQRRHRVRDISAQAQVSLATVDRVLHDRPGVSDRARRAVARAIADLDRQADQVRLTGRHLVLDLVVQAPMRFSALVLAALEAESARVRPAVVRVRPHLEENADVTRAGETLRRLADRGSDGVVVKAPDAPPVRDAVDALVAAGVPVVTLATDLQQTRRHVAVGLDHASAGRTAAYLAQAVVGEPAGAVLITLSRTAFTGEGIRVRAFTEAISARPGWTPIVLDGSDGLDSTMASLVRDALAHLSVPVVAVYSVGGGNRGILAALDTAGITVKAFIAHDLDGDNVDLLRHRRLTAVLHHDLRADASRAVAAILQLRGLMPEAPVSIETPVGVITPYNIPTWA